MQTIIDTIDGITSLTDEAQLRRLEAAMDAYFAAPDAADHLDVWFRLYERFPEDDAFGICWTILHGIERFPASDRLVVASVRRKPSSFPVMMINRLINSGQSRVGDVELLALLQAVSLDQTAPERVRAEAAGLVEYKDQKRVAD
jgi:hypothetical protein